MKRAGWAGLALAVVAVAACGPGVTTKVTRLPPAKDEAVAELHAGLRQIRLGPASYPRALERLEAARRIDPALWEAWYDTGWVMSAMHNPDGAAEAYEKVLAIQPTHVETVKALAAVHLQRRRPQDAERVCRSFLTALPPPATPTTRPAKTTLAVRVILATALRQLGKLDDAIEELRKVLRVEPASAPALGTLGLVYEAKSQHELAELVLRRAIEIEPTRAAPWNDLGLVLLAERRDQEAFAAFEKASQLDPSLGEARYNKASVYLDCGDYNQAARELHKLTSAQPGNTEAQVALGVAERGLGKHDDARKAYERALDLDPNHPNALYNLGVLLMDWKKDPSGARSALTRFLRAADGKHPRRADADKRMLELAPPPAPPTTTPATVTPAKAGG